MPHKDPAERSRYLAKWRGENQDRIKNYAEERKKRWLESEERIRHNERCSRRYHADSSVNERQKEQLRQRKREDKIHAFDYFGWECFDCGETDINVIEFDHVPEKGPKLANPSKLMGMAHFYEVTEKCEPVCCNCHRKRTLARKQQTK